MTILLKNSKLLIIILVFFLFEKNEFAQSPGDPKEDFLDGEYYVSQGMFADALPSYLSILKKNPENSNVNYRVGLCYMKIPGEESKALPYLQKATGEIDMKYIEGRFKSTGAPPETLILLGDSYVRQNRLDEAYDAFIKYRDLIGTDVKKLKVINKRIDEVANSKELQKTSQNLQILSVSSIINTKYSEINPVLSADQNTMVYTQDRDAVEKIMMTHRTGTTWSQPVEITRQLGSEGDCFATWISNDGSHMLLVCHDDMNDDIFEAQLIKNKWQKMELIPGKINSKYNESGACISPDGNTLYFCSDRPKGLGGYDIYTAEKTGTNWGNIKNIGNIINTDMDEKNPYITTDGKVLYFSSNGHKSVGNMDILYSEKGPDGNWKAPVNPGKPINTTADETSYIYFDDTKTGYVSIDLPQGNGKNDIYKVSPKVEEAAIIDSTPIITEKVVKEEVPVIKDTVIEQKKTEVASIEKPKNEEIKNTKVVKKTESPAHKDKNVEKIKVKEVSKTTLNAVSDTTSIYTIQIMALLHAKTTSTIKLSSLKISEGSDGYSRYTVGEYKDLSKAQKSLSNIRKRGYKGAFIRKIQSISNYNNN